MLRMMAWDTEPLPVPGKTRPDRYQGVAQSPQPPRKQLHAHLEGPTEGPRGQLTPGSLRAVAPLPCPSKVQAQGLGSAGLTGGGFTQLTLACPILSLGTFHKSRVLLIPAHLTSYLLPMSSLAHSGPSDPNPAQIHPRDSAPAWPDLGYLVRQSTCPAAPFFPQHTRLPHSSPASFTAAPCSPLSCRACAGLPPLQLQVPI